MPLVHVNDVGSYGFSKGAPAYELPPGMWTRVRNMRCAGLGAERTLGDAAALGTPVAGANPVFVFPTVDNDKNLYWFYCGLDAIYATDGTTHEDISKAGGYTATLDGGWQGTTFNGIPVLNNGVNTPQYWGWDLTTPTACLDIPGFAAIYNSARIVRAFGSFLVALDVTESATRYPYLLAWSDAGAAGSLPTSWDYTSTTNRAGQSVRSGPGGALVDGEVLGDVFYIYKENAIEAMQFIGGSAVMSFRGVSEEIGALSKNCIAKFKRMHLVLGQGDVVIHNGGTPESILDQSDKMRRLRTWFFQQIDSTNYRRSYVVANYAKSEIWMCVPETGSDFASLALIWNFQENTFGLRELGTIRPGQVGYSGLPHVAFGIVTDTQQVTWNAATDLWDDANYFWNQVNFNPTLFNLLGADYGNPDTPTDGSLLKIDSELTHTESAEAFAERTGLAIIGRRNDGGYNVDINVNKFIRALYPRIEIKSGSGTIKIQVGAQQYIDGPVQWETAQEFNPATMEKINCTVNGRFIAVRFLSNASDTFSWEVKGYSLDLSLGAKW